MRDILGMEGFDVEEAGDGAECLEKIRKRKPGIVFLDIDMPRINGWQICRKLREQAQTRNLPIIMISAHAQASDKEQALEAGASLFLSKPVEMDALMDVLKKFGLA